MGWQDQDGNLIGNDSIFNVSETLRPERTVNDKYGEI